MATKQEESKGVTAPSADELHDMYKRLGHAGRRQVSERAFETIWFALSENVRNRIGIMYLQHGFEMSAAIEDVMAEDRDSKDSESDDKEEAPAKKEMKVEQDVDNEKEESKADLMDIETLKHEDVEVRDSGLQDLKAEIKMEEDSECSKVGAKNKKKGLSKAAHKGVSSRKGSKRLPSRYKEDQGNTFKRNDVIREFATLAEKVNNGDAEEMAHLLGVLTRDSHRLPLEVQST